MNKNTTKIDKSYLLLKNWWEMIELSNYEKCLLNKDIVSFNQQLLRLKEKILRIGVYGKAGVGKSSTLNSILNEDFFNTGILNGSTENIKSKEWTLNKGLIRRIELIDSPGFDICKKKKVERKVINILNLDLILFITSGDLNRNELSAINLFIKNGKKIIIILNKIDIWNNKEIENIKNNIKAKLPNHIKIPIINNSNKNYIFNQEENIHNYLIKTFNRIGYSLIIYNTFQLANKLELNIKKRRLIKRKKEAQIIIGKFATLKASSVAVNPLLFLDIAGSFALDTALIKELSRIYGLKIKSNSARKLIKAISINNISLVAAQVTINTLFNLIKKFSLIAAPFTHGFSLLPYGPVAIIQAALAVSTTKIIGKLAAKEILNKSKISRLEPFKKIQQIALKDTEIASSKRIFLYNQENHKDFSLFIP